MVNNCTQIEMKKFFKVLFFVGCLSLVFWLTTQGLFFLAGLTSLVIWGLVRIKKDLDLRALGAENFILAYNANTIALAKEYWEKGIKFLEDNNLTTGNTGAFWKTPEDDLEFFYKNVVEMRNYLNTPPDTLSDSSFDQKIVSGSTLSKGDPLTVFDRKTLSARLKKTWKNAPEGIEIYPNNCIYAIWGWISGLVCIVFAILWFISTF